MASISKTVRPKRSNNNTVSPSGYGLTVGQGTAVVAGGGGGGSVPTPSGTIIFDTRAGGAEDWQVQTTLAGLHSVWSYGDTTRGSFATDCDGSGTNGKRIDWTSGNPAIEQTCQLMKYLPANNSAANGMYWQWKVKYASNFVYNSNGQGAKIWLGLRANDNSTDRLYWVESNAGWKVACDSRGWTTSTYGTGPAVDTVLTYTIFCKGPGGIVKCWRDDTLVIDLTGQDINTSGFTEMQFNVAEYVPVVTYQYVWDFVVWVP